MKRLAIKSLSAVLSALVILLSPGVAPYAAAANQLSKVPVLPGVKTGVSTPNLSLPAVTLSAPAGNVIPEAVRYGSLPLAVAVPNVAVPNVAAAKTLAPQAAALDAVLQNAQAPGETVGAVAARTFEGALKKPELQAIPVVSGVTASVSSTGLAKSSLSSSHKTSLVSRVSRAGRGLVARYKDSPKPVKTFLAAAAAIVATVALPYYIGAAVAVPMVLGSCASMQEQAIKEKVILPQENDQARKALAKIELDAALVQFGKDLRKVAMADKRVKSAVSAHDAEHAMEEPMLELLPKWKQQWKEGKGPTKEEALKELRAAVVDRLGRKVLSREDEALVEELFSKTGGWDSILKWEEKYGILEALKKAAEAEAKAEAEQQKVDVKAGGSNENSGTMGGSNMLSVALLVGLGGVLHLLGVDPASNGMVVAGVAGMLGAVKDNSPKPGEPVAIEAYLKDVGLDSEEIEMLMSFTTDMGAKDIAPVIGRTKEIQKVITILSNPPGMQNNPMLLGDKGVGKTAVVEAVAKRLYENRLPSLKGKRILEVDMGRILAGASARGEVEKRILALRDIASKTNNRVVLFIDEIHTLLKNNSSSESVPDLLKTPLRDGAMTMIGATTVGEYNKYVEKDPAFADRFDTVNIDEPTQEEAIEMLEGNLEFLEKKYEAKIDPAAAEAAVRLSSRYIPERFLPRKAHMLLRKAIAEAKPAAAKDGLQVQIDQLADRLRIFVRRYAKLAKEGDEGDAAKRAEIVRAYNRIVSAYQTILQLEDRQRALKDEVITREHVARTLAKETGLEIGDMTADDYEKLKNMEPWFKDRVVGQDDAVQAVAEAVRRNKSGMADPDKPVGVFMFAGPTGVGKTEIARRLAEYLFNDKDAMVRLDMSEYMEKHTVSRLFGAPPGYVGYDEGGQLTEAVRRKPYSVVLLDEIEKAHDDVLLGLLQVFEDGRMTDGKGRVVNFKNTIIIMTSNLGAQATTAEELIEYLKRRLRPEFINRVDKIVRFNGLDQSQAEMIVRIQSDRVRKRLRTQDLELVLEPKAVSYIANKYFDAAFGARPLKRAVESEIAGKAGDFLLEKKADGTLINGGVLTVDSDGEALKFSLKPNPPPSVEMQPLPDGPLGAKLRNIMEEAVRNGGEDAKDLRKFEALLFPDRFDVTLESKLGTFETDGRPEGAFDSNASETIDFNAPLGEREPAAENLLALLDKKLEGRWDDKRREAVEAFLEGFVALAKTSRRPPATEGAELAAGGVYALPPEEAGDFALNVYAPLDSEKRQALLRTLRDHMTVPLEDEGAVRKRAGDLKDEGKTPDRSLLEAKRLIESIPGARFGFNEDQGNANFWVTFPVWKKPEAKPEEQPAAAEQTPAEPEAPAIIPEEARPSTLFLPDFQAPKGGELIYNEPSPRIADTIAVTTREVLNRNRVAAASLDAAAYWIEKAAGGIEEATGSSSSAFTVTKRSDGSLVVTLYAPAGRDLRGTAFYQSLMDAPEDLQSIIGAIPGASFGVGVARVDGAERLEFWLLLPAEAAAPAEEPAITAIEARASPGKMLLYLAPAANNRLGAFRKMVAGLLDSKASASRLVGLHLAAGLLSKKGFAEVAAVSRGVRVADTRDAALFAELSARAQTGMSAQRKTVRDSVEGALSNFQRAAVRDLTREVGDGSPSGQLYTKLLARLGEKLGAKEAADLRKAKWTMNMKMRRGALLFVLLQAAALAVCAALLTWAEWNRWFMLILSVAGSAGVWWGYAVWRGDRRPETRANAAYIDRVLAKIGEKKDADSIPEAWLKRAAKGRLNSVPPAELAAALSASSTGERTKLFRNWINGLTRFFGNEKRQRNEPRNAPEAQSLVFLGHLHDAVPVTLRQGATNLMLQPIRSRWLPNDRDGYVEALGVWLAAAQLNGQEIDSALDALTSFPIDSRNNGWQTLLPALLSLSGQKLDNGQRSAIDQLLASLSAEEYERITGGANNNRGRNTNWNPENFVTAARARARTGAKAAAWEGLRAPLTTPAPNNWGAEAARELARLIKENKPTPLVRAWLDPLLRNVLANNNNSNDAAGPALRLALARLTDDPAEKVTMLVAALNVVTVDNADQPLYAELLDDLYEATAALRKASPRDAEAMDRAVNANVSRLAESQL